MTLPRILELGIALAIIVAGVVLYRRPAPDGDRYGSQGAVILLVVGAIVCLHALGFLHLFYYRTSADENGMLPSVLR